MAAMAHRHRGSVTIAGMVATIAAATGVSSVPIFTAGTRATGTRAWASLEPSLIATAALAATVNRATAVPTGVRRVPIFTAGKRAPGTCAWDSRQPSRPANEPLTALDVHAALSAAGASVISDGRPGPE